MVLKFFADKAVFKQKIQILSNKDFTITGSLEFMCCDDKQCLPPNEVEFAFDIKGNPAATKTATTQPNEIERPISQATKTALPKSVVIEPDENIQNIAIKNIEKGYRFK